MPQKFILATLIISKQIHFTFAAQTHSVLKQALFFLLTFSFPFLLTARQQQDTVINKKDTITKVPLLLQPAATDTAVKKKDTIINPAEGYNNWLQKKLKENIFLNSSGIPVAVPVKEKKPSSQGLIFYILLVAAALLAFIKFFYTRYFNNLFRVFFNTSLRQGQLTDQLLQAKQASLFFNILFIISSGLYIYFLLLHYHWVAGSRVLFLIACSIASVLLIYLVKFIVLKFTGWVTGYRDAANTYVFIIFLINKIVGIILMPFIIVIAFSDELIKNSAVVVSLLIIGLMFLLRFFRSYGLLQHQLKVSRLHFFIYIAGIEVLPLLLIYKGLLVLLNKNL